MENKEIEDMITSTWREKVYVETTEHIICGYVFMPKIGKKNRMLSDLLNGNNNFIAVKDCTLEYKLNSRKNIEHHAYIQVNLSSILIMRALDEE